ncbi:protein kinase domain-containing protein [Leptolyngbya sp. AN03gr2]|uniref:protein kinase domain-containing protein n=1 Tax=unclassified Leptolyngbya TaxID=2650499 RepID=UPI003D319887
MLIQELQAFQGGFIPIHVEEIKEVKLLELLGAGRFGTVWKVQDIRTKNLYVLKIIQNIEPSSRLVHRVRLEASVTISSNYIIPVIGLREWNDSTFLILFEYFSAKSLDRVLREETLTVARKRFLFDQILRGVADAHKNNIIHRDLKPANILVGENDVVKLIDFGLAKFKATGFTKTGDMMGTPPYMSPEISIEGSKFSDARTDIYALGQILYEMSMGYTFWAKQGWRSGGFYEFTNFLKQLPPPTECIVLSDFSCDLYSNAKQVLARMVKRDPKERYATVNEVIEALCGESIRADVPEVPREPYQVNLKYPLLIVESGTNKNACTLVRVDPGEQLVLGRIDIAGSDRSISRRHLVFTRQGNRYFVSDIRQKAILPNSELNPTLVSGVALEPNAAPTELLDGTRLKVGDIFLRVVLPS